MRHTHYPSKMVGKETTFKQRNIEHQHYTINGRERKRDAVCVVWRFQVEKKGNRKTPQHFHWAHW